MPLLVRAAPERNTLRRVTTLYLWLTMKLAAYDELEGAFLMFSVCAVKVVHVPVARRRQGP